MKAFLEKIALFFLGVGEKAVSFFKGVSKKTYATLAIFLIAAILVLDVGYHLIGSLSGGVETMPARGGTLTETLSSDAYLLREETLLADSGGQYLYRVENGEKVNVGTLLADVYADDTDPLLLASLSAALQAERLLEAADSARPEKLSNTLSLRIQGLLADRDGYLASGEIAKANAANEALAVYMFCREELAGAVDIGTILASLRASIDGLNDRIGTPVRSVYAESVGWFSYTADGYESFAVSSSLEDMDYTELLSLFTPKTVSTPQSVGKMISSYVFHFVTFVSSADAEIFSVNRKYDLTLDGTPLTATLEKMTFQSGEDRVALTFSSTTLSAAFSLARISEMVLVKEEYEGIKLPTAALVENDGVYGVYILKGFVVEFREIQLLYREGSTVIVAKKPDKTSGLHRTLTENDNVIIKGDDLYDGKILKRVS